MGKPHDEIEPDLADWLGKQKIFFVATAPLSADGHVNCSPKGMDSFRILGPRRAAYVDLTGSGVETIAHLRENRRIVLMFCAFEGPPKIVRLYGFGTVHVVGSSEFDRLSGHFPEHTGMRSIVDVELTRIAHSCGYSVPRFDFAGERDTLVRWAESKGADGLLRYRNDKNVRSLDDLPGLDPVR